MKYLEVNKVLNIVKNNTELYRVILMFTSLVCSALLYNIFLFPLNLVTGGTPGIATITKYTHNIDPAITLFILSTITAILSFIFLGFKRTIGSLIAGSIILPLLVELTTNIYTLFDFSNTDTLMLVIFAGVLSGVSNGLMYKSGYSNGGFPIISQILFEKCQISIALSSLIINITIVIIGGFFFGFTNVLYAIVFLYINNIVLDKVLLGISNNKAFYIITSKEEEIRNYIVDNMNHTITTFAVKGGFLEKKRHVLLVVTPSREYYNLNKVIKSIDKQAFFVATNAYEVEGAK